MSEDERISGRKKVDVLVWAGIVLLAFPLFSSQKRISLQRVDISGLPEISVYFTLTDDTGNSVLGATADEIAVSIDGAAQKISLLKSALEGGEFLAVGLILDRSGSMKQALDKTKMAAINFTKRMSERDQLAVISFDDHVRVDSGFSKDLALVEKAIAGITIGKDTALYDAVQKGLELLEKVSTRRQALVLLSDGKDTRSKLKKADVLGAAKDKSVSLFTIGLGPSVDEANLAELAAETGGNFFRAAEPGDLLQLYQTIAEQLKNQYVLVFDSSFGRDEAWHDLSIAYKDPLGSEFKETKKFLATTSPGVSRGILTGALRRQEYQSYGWAAGLGALIGLGLGLLILIVIRLLRREAGLYWLYLLGLLLAAAILGGILGLLVMNFK